MILLDAAAPFDPVTLMKTMTGSKAAGLLIAAVCIAAFAALLLIRRKRRKKQNETGEGENK